MGQFIDLTNQRFGRWTVLKKSQSIGNGKKPSIMWVCKCDCGEIREVFGHSLRSGVSFSCGCLHKERVSETSKYAHRTHGNSRSRLYGVWQGMIDRAAGAAVVPAVQGCCGMAAGIGHKKGGRSLLHRKKNF